MKFHGTALISCAALFVTTVIATSNTENSSINSKTPTHIIKLKNNSYNGIAAHNLIVSKHREYMLKSLRAASLDERKKDKRGIPFMDSLLDQEAQLNEQDFLLQAQDMERQLSLDHIKLDNEFVAISGIFPDNGFIDTIHNDHDVDYVEPNYIYKATFLLPEDDMTILFNEQDSENNNKVYDKRTLSPNVDWGLSRINKRTLNELDSHDFDESAGSGIEVFVLDSGVNIGHKDFEGRAKTSANFIHNEDSIDLGGHGTHVAGKIAGKEYGVAKSANILSVKILNHSGDGTLGNLVKGLSHVVKTATPGKAIVNLSLSGPKSKLIDEAISKLVNEYNIPVFVSAGNSGTDACYFTPSSNPNVFSVGATDINDQVPYYSNTGTCVKLYAPGSNIKSTWIHSNNEETKVLDGTSMANPHVVGIAASLMSKKTFNSPKELYQAILSKATSNMLTFVSPVDPEINNNLIAFNEIV